MTLVKRVTFRLVTPYNVHVGDRPILTKSIELLYLDWIDEVMKQNLLYQNYH